METRTLHTVVALLVAGLLLTSVGATYYFYQNQESSASNQHYANELGTAITEYKRLSDSFNASLADYNRTLSLLASAISDLNTSSPAYRQATLALSSLWSSYQALASADGRKAITFSVHMLVDYGNGTSRWYNDSGAQPGWNGYVVTLVLLNGDVKSTWYPQYGEHLISGLGGRNQTSTESWFLWVFSDGSWAPSQTGVDQISVDNGTVIAWTLCSYDANYNPSCVP